MDGPAKPVQYESTHSNLPLSLSDTLSTNQKTMVLT